MIRHSPAFTRTKWFLPLFSVAMGGLLLAASWLGGHPGAGLVFLAAMTVFGLVILLVCLGYTLSVVRLGALLEVFQR